MSIRILAIDKCINLQQLERKRKEEIDFLIFSQMKESVVTNPRDAWRESVTEVSRSPCGQIFCYKEVWSLYIRVSISL